MAHLSYMLFELYNNYVVYIIYRISDASTVKKVKNPLLSFNQKKIFDIFPFPYFCKVFFQRLDYY